VNDSSQSTVILKSVKIPAYLQDYIFRLPFKRPQETYKFTNRNIKIHTEYAQYLPLKKKGESLT
jgi:hypothetical protein